MKVQGKTNGDGACLLDGPGEDEWIIAEYRNGWVGRKLLGGDDDAYAEMVEPFYQRCAMCREWKSVQRWGAGSPYCPRCEQWRKWGLPKAIEWVLGEVEFNHSCPDCGSENVEIGVIADYDCECFACGSGFDLRVPREATP